MTHESCVFCRIVRKEIPAVTLFEDEQVLAFSDVNKMAPVHALIIPKKHIESINSIEMGDEALLGRLLVCAQKLAKNLGVADSGFRLAINSGADAGQSVFHLHVHLLGGRSMQWPPG